ncbi:Putative deoxyribonuclease RhsC [Vibrio mangrovi]|nr:Putative deoxyribonuclease RhsC [Vibrio mangrovi]
MGRLSEHRVSQAQQQTLFRRYQYNRSGNLTQVEDNLRGLTQYQYDPLDRLTSVRGSVSETFAHDPAGNLIQDQLSNVEGNRLLFQGDCHYQYDEFGNLIQEARGTNQSLVTTYEYDGQHRLTRVEKHDGTIAEYQYDAFGRRIQKAVTDKTGHQKTTEFLWQGDKLLAESGDSHYQTYLYEYGSFKPLALITGEGAANATPYFYHLDQIGTPLEITDATGQVAWSVDYHSYGNVAYQRKAEIVSPLRFQGQYYDEETGLHYNRHRYYSPNTGRFITVDPIGLAGGLNNYQYVKNPTGWIDPLGLMSVPGDCPGKSPKYTDNASKLGTIEGEYSAINPGPLDDGIAGTFSGGRYKVVSLKEDTILYRAGTESNPYGQFFSVEPPISEIQTRIDKAVLPVWPGGGKSPIDTAFELKIPAGTKVYVGEVGSQSKAFIGGTEQIVVLQPWALEGVEVMGSKALK